MNMFLLLAGSDFDAMAAPIVSLINSFVNPALAIVGALGLIYCIILGVRFATAEDPQAHEKAKKGLKNAIIGFVLIFVLMFALKFGMGAMQNWLQNAEKTTTTTSQSK